MKQPVGERRRGGSALGWVAGAVWAWAAAAAAAEGGAGANCRVEWVSPPRVAGRGAARVVGFTVRVADGEGNAVRGLRPGDFHVGFEGLRPEAAEVRFERTFAGPGAACVVFVVQTAGGDSAAYGTRVRPGVAALAGALGQKVPGADFALVCAGSKARRALMPFPEASLVARGLPAEAEAGEEPALMEALRDAVELIPRDAPARAIVVFSDGVSRPGPVSPVNVAALAQQAGCPVFAIAPSQGEREREPQRGSSLPYLTRDTRGRLFSHGASPDTMAQAIADAAACHYRFEAVVARDALRGPSGGRWLKVGVRTPEWVGEARYFVRQGVPRLWLVLLFVGVGAVLLVVVVMLVVAPRVISPARPASSAAAVEAEDESSELYE